MPTAHQASARLYSLDVLRGIAAFAVVFWHWQHFSYDGTKPDPTFRREEQPLYDVFFLFYNSGGSAVDLFFCLSGFIFFWLYARAIADRNVSAKEFFILRFSRLYPLHLCTLIVVLLGQTLYVEQHRTWFIYGQNDLRHFILNLFFLSSVGWEYGHSFNAPAWSISVEIILYACFFLLCWITRAQRVFLAGASIGLAIAGFGAVEYEPFNRGFGSFFTGGATYCLYSSLVVLKRKVALTKFMVLATTSLWIATLWFSYSRISLSALPISPRVPRFFRASSSSRQPSSLLHSSRACEELLAGVCRFWATFRIHPIFGTFRFNWHSRSSFHLLASEADFSIRPARCSSISRC
jgi:peptidoglycan/LPS O-acetylase OafA/YrhL